jgi:hypothetical protein
MLISTNDGKHLRANMHIGGRGYNSRNLLHRLPPHHSTRADLLDD